MPTNRGDTATRATVIAFLRAEYGPDVDAATLEAVADEMTPEQVRALLATVEDAPWLLEPEPISE